MARRIMAHEAAGPMPGIFQSGVVTSAQTAIVTGVSVLVLAAASWAGFAILVRPYARSLCLTFLAVCTLLLLPERASAPGMAVLAALAGVFLWLETKRFRVAPEFATWEGWAVRIMFLMPLCIAAVRAAFYLHDLTMYAMLFGIAGGFLLLLIRHDFRPWIAEALRAVASVCLGMAWLLLAFDILAFRYDYFWFAVIFPLGLVLLAVGHFAPRSGAFYRWLGMAFIAMASYALIVISLFAIVGLSLRAIEVDTWLVLAVAGIALVLLSSVAERFGLPLLQVHRFLRNRDNT